ncbi:MAG: sulfurtransferase [Deltaproteobacteria bacterium]|nr:MAG: sulfurtransferase [Deltaproteobacteria bacterium]
MTTLGTTTLFSEGLLGSQTALVAAAAIGIAFGFFLERAGFGSSKKLVAMFYMKDFAVLKVMFTAVVTALIGIRGLAAFGAVDLGNWYQMETFLVPQISAGLLFGMGFVMGGWCPGTAVVGSVSGRWDALVFLGGAAIGSLVYAVAYPALSPVHDMGALGVSTLDDVLGVSPGVAALFVILLALTAFLGSNKLAAKRAQRIA